MSSYEVNFDGLVGLTHHYAGLSYGNVASLKNKNQLANPKSAALQGLLKMKTLMDLGFKQGVLAPQERPCIETLRSLGFTGNDAKVLAQAAKHPYLLSASSSASSMWVANAATVSPSADTQDGKVHFTVANLNNAFHRSIEAETTHRSLKATFNSEAYFTHHKALPQQALFGDEGAANHNRLCSEYGKAGVELFVYGRKALGGDSQHEPVKFPARQTYEASEAITRLHQLESSKFVFIQQNPSVIDQGVFHNDVISVSNGPVLFYHEMAFLNQEAAFSELTEKLALNGTEFIPICVPTNQVSLEDAISSYLFNSQLLSKKDGKMVMIVPQEVEDNPRVWKYLCALITSDCPINEVKVLDLRESMRNGGGPACLRLRVALKEQEINACNQQTLLNDMLYARLTDWVNAHYRDRLTEQELVDPQLLIENREALDELTQILALGSIYPFQR